MNDEQKCFADALIDKIINQNGGEFIGCLDGAAVTGKTFTLNTVIARTILAGKQ